MLNRRSFLTGLLAAPAVITTPRLLMPVRAWADIPVFIGDGIHDDTAAVQAAIDGLPFDAPHGNIVRDGVGVLFRAARIRLTDTIEASHGQGFTQFDGCSFEISSIAPRKPVWNVQNVQSSDLVLISPRFINMR